MDPELQKLLDEQKKVFEAFKTENDKLKASVDKTGNEHATTRQNVENLNKKLDELQDSISKQTKAAEDRANQLEAMLNRTAALGGSGGGSAEDAARHLASFNAIAGHGASADDLKNYRPAFDHYLRNGDRAQKPELMNALSVGSDPNGGYWVTPDTTGMIVKKIYETSPIRQIASVVTIGTDALEGMIDNGEASTGWVGETASRDETNTPQVGEWRIPVYEQYAAPRITQKLLDDAQFNVESWLAEKVTSKMARTENTAFVSGTSIRQPRGFLSYTYVATADSTRSWGQLQYVASGASGAFATNSGTTNAADYILDLIYALKAMYRNGATFVMARATVGAVRKLKDGNNNYLWQPSATAGQPSTLFDFPITEAEDMPAIAANSLSIAFGNFKEGYQIVDRQGVRVLRDPFTAKPYVIFYTTKRVGGDVVNFEAIKALKFAAS